MNQKLAKTLVRCFDRSHSTTHTSFSPFSGSDWRSVDTWLDTSGIALYFLERLKQLNLTASIPAAVLGELELKAYQHEQRVAEQFEEFSCVVDLLWRNGIRFAVQKGYSLIPDYSPDPRLRLQLDFDLLMDVNAVSDCNQLLSARGYELINQVTDSFHHEWKLRRGETGIPRLSDLYKPKGEFTIEVHSKLIPTAPAVVVWKQVRGLTFPSLRKIEVFEEQCLHVFRHLRSEQTRLSWILEYSNFVRGHCNDQKFWCQIRTRCDDEPNFACAFLCLDSLASHYLGEFAPSWLVDMKAKYLSNGVRKWLSRYAWDVALAQFPGTKLYLLLERELIGSQKEWQRMARRALFPVHQPPQVMARTQNGTRKRQYSLGRLRHICARTKFHVREACRISYELVRWSIS